MPRYRFKYEKYDRMRFIGHLDLIRLFQRAVKRAGIPIEYSQGFNPHQQMSFALPLSVGMAGYGEYVEIELSKEQAAEEVIRSLGAELPYGLRISAGRVLGPREKTAAALTEAALYEIIFQNARDDMPERLEEVLARDEIIMTKRAKTGPRESDIRPDIHELTGGYRNGSFVISAVLSAGGKGNLKPQILAECLISEAVGTDIEIEYKRMDLLMKKGQAFATLL